MARKVAVCKSAKTGDSKKGKNNSVRKAIKKSSSRKVTTPTVSKVQSGKMKKRKRSDKETEISKNKKAKKTAKGKKSELKELKIPHDDSKLSKEEPSTKKQKSKKIDVKESELKEFKISDENSEPAEEKEKEEKVKLMVTENKDWALKCEEEANNLKIEVFELKKVIKEKVEEETRKDQEIMNLRSEAEQEARKFDAVMKEKEVQLNESLRDVEQMKQTQLKCEEEHEKTKSLLDDRLRETRSRNEELRSELTRQLKKAEDVHSKCQLSLEKVQKTAETLEAELQGDHWAKILMECEEMEIYTRLDAGLKKLENECNIVRMLRKEKDLAECCVTEELSLMKENAFLSKALEKQSTTEKSTGAAKLKVLTSRLEAVWKAANVEKIYLQKKAAVKFSTKEADINKQKSEKNGLEKLVEEN